MKKFNRMKSTLFTVLLIASSLVCSVCAQESQRFETPEEAVAALRAATKAQGNSQFMELFGEETRLLLENDDDTGIEESRRLLNLLFEERWDLAETEEGNQLLRLGMEGWPFPVPIVSSDSVWYFDTESGLEEIANRRIGRNELAAIETCLRILDAQEDYRLSDPNNDGVREYTSLFRSSQGKKDGLYWAAAQGEALSPLQLALQDSWKYAEGRTEDAPWFGYRFRFLESQGPDAPGGAYDYEINDHQVGGFALVAYPATYAESGVMTFLINQNGKLYQNDLGEDTETAVRDMNRFNPNDNWQEVVDVVE